MAKDIPYFKFFPAEWITGDITLCSLEAKGLFIDICSFYWAKSCSISLAFAKQRFQAKQAQLKELFAHDIIKVDDDDNLVIDFLDEQMNEFSDLSRKRSLAGKKGGQAKAKQLPEFAKAKPDNKEKRREEKTISKPVKKGFVPPELTEVVSYFSEKGFNEAYAKKVFEYYDSAGWQDAHGKKVLAWKQKMLANWLKEECREQHGIKKRIYL